MASDNESLSWRFYFLNVLVLGALLGVADTAVGALARGAGLPRGPFATGAGFAVIALGLAVFKQKRVIPGITLAAILGKWLALPLLGLPLLCQANSHLAVLLNGAFLFAGVALFRGQVASGWRSRGAIAGAAAFGSGAAFFALGRYWAPCAHLLSFRTAGGASHYLLTRVAPAALLAAALFPLGYAMGRKLEAVILPAWLHKRWFVYPVASALALAGWGLSVWLAAAGF
jgi:hypothetical protein